MIESANCLSIGYLMQNGAPDLGTLSGPQLHTVAVIEALKELGHRVQVVALQQNGIVCSEDLQNWRRAQFGVSRALWFRLIERSIRRSQSELNLPYIGAFESFRYADAVAHEISTPQVLYERFGWMGYGGIIASRRLGIPHVLEMNGNIVKENDELGVDLSPVQRRICQGIIQRTLYATDHIVAVSAALKQQLVSAFDLLPEKVSVVHNGANVNLFLRAFDRTAVRTAHAIPPDPAIVFVGSFQPWHGVNLLVDSFYLVQQCFPDIQLLLVGDGTGRDTVERQISALGLQDKVRLLGRLPQEQVAALLSVAEIAVAPYPLRNTDIVGTPLKLIEYMAAGKAIVASTAPIHEIIEDDVTGVRVAPADAQALASGIMRLLANPDLRHRLGEHAREVAQQFTWQHVGRELGRIFANVIDLRNKEAL